MSNKTLSAEQWQRAPKLQHEKFWTVLSLIASITILSVTGVLVGEEKLGTSAADIIKLAVGGLIAALGSVTTGLRPAGDAPPMQPTEGDPQ